MTEHRIYFLFFENLLFGPKSFVLPARYVTHVSLCVCVGISVYLSKYVLNNDIMSLLKTGRRWAFFSEDYWIILPVDWQALQVLIEHNKRHFFVRRTQSEREHTHTHTQLLSVVW